MVGRYDLCPCGNQQTYEHCCRRNTLFRVTNRLSIGRSWLMKIHKNKLPQVCMYRLRIHGSICFEPLLLRPPNHLFPQDLTVQPVQNGLSFDVSPFSLLMNPGKQEIEQNLTFSKPKCQITTIHDGSYIRTEVVDIREKSMLVRTLPIPYTSFAHEMRGEILVQLEKYNRYDKERQDFTASTNGWRVLGWSIKRAKELEQIEKIVVARDRLGGEQLHIQPSCDQEKQAQSGLSVEIMGHFDQFYSTCVEPLQGRTQALYGRSIELLYQYLSTRFGQSFQWSMLDEEALLHFLGVWYLEQSQSSSSAAAKVFLNTLKKLFYWLAAEQITDLNNTFQRVYLALIRALPITVEVRKWLRENGVQPLYQRQSIGQLGMYQLATSPGGPVVLVNDRWVPIKLNGYPPMWSENSFWVCGCIEEQNQQAMFTHIENVYPVVPIEAAHNMMHQR